MWAIFGQVSSVQLGLQAWLQFTKMETCAIAGSSFSEGIEELLDPLVFQAVATPSHGTSRVAIFPTVDLASSIATAVHRTTLLRVVSVNISTVFPLMHEIVKGYDCRLLGLLCSIPAVPENQNPLCLQS